jgi:hypothetical protein
MKVSIKMALNKVVNSVDDVVLQGLLLVLDRTNIWIGTMTDLSELLVRTVDKRTKRLLPKSASALGIVTKRVVNRLRNRRVSVKFFRAPCSNRTRLVKLLRK